MSPFSLGTKILGTGALLLLLFLSVGLLLPGTWDAEATRLLPADRQAVMPFVDSPEGWRQWTPWPEGAVVRSGPEHGAGATLSWDDPDLGAGSFTLVRVDPGEVEYFVEVGDGSMQTHGTITLTPQDGGVLVFWHEHGDLGRNPLMGWWALSMGRAQGKELAKGLERLEGLVTGAGTTSAQPGDSPDQPTADSVPGR